jgi:hypothetical protein
MAAANVFTGFKEVDAALEQFDNKVRRSHIRRALNESVKVVEKDFKERCPVETDEFGDDVGAMRDSIKRYTPKRKANTQRRGLRIVKEVLMNLYFQRKGRFPGKRTSDSEPFFYPAVIELGDSDREPARPMRDALYGNQQTVMSVFENFLRKAVGLAGRDNSADLPEVEEEK